MPSLPRFKHNIKQKLNKVRYMFSKKLDLSGTSCMSHWSILGSYTQQHFQSTAIWQIFAR